MLANFFNKIKSWLSYRANISFLLHQQRNNLKMDYLKQCVVSCKEMGVTSERFCDHEVVVSLTSYGERIRYAYLAIESIMQGALKPNRIVLWLSDDEKDKILPATLQLQIKRGLEVRYCPDIRSYTKIIPSLQEFPDACIVTIDDDMIYDVSLLDNLVYSYQENPTCVIANRTHLITFDDKRMPKSYLQWNWYSWENTPSHRNFFTGCGGVLYPPNCLDSSVFDFDVFNRICYTADDIWLNAMAIKNGTKTAHCALTDCCETSASDIYGLAAVNNNASDCKNDIQLKAVFEKYNLYDKLV